MAQHKHTTNSEILFSQQEQLISTTDTRGVITYANDVFCKVSGYELNELTGKNHNIVRHPDMPKAAYADMWGHLKAGRPWQGIVKNRCKDGAYYWVDAYITPIYNGSTLQGYQSVRVKPNVEQIKRAAALYQDLNAGRTRRLKSSVCSKKR